MSENRTDSELSPKNSDRFRIFNSVTHALALAMLSLVVGTVWHFCESPRSWGSNQIPKTTKIIATEVPSPHLMSIVSCASCHGSHDFLETDNPSERWRSVYQIWISRDPHAGAYHTLRNQQSRQIVFALAASKSAQPSAIRLPPADDLDYQAVLNERCIACHSSVPASLASELIAISSNENQKSAIDLNLQLASGVNCHSCHSVHDLDNPNGKEWIEAHTQETWNSAGVDKVAYGLRNLNALDVRAQTCVKCHVGSAAGDVNHDLIAAGHPRMEFEFSSHLARLPKHWEENEESSFHAKCWSIGQTEAARASLSLLQFRAAFARQQNGPWPEFSEYDCQSCHHALVTDGPFSTVSARAETAFQWRWDFSEWTGDDAGLLAKLRNEMRKPHPEALTIEQLATNQTFLAQELDPIAQLAATIERQPRLTRNESAHWYLAVQAGLADFPVSEAAEQQRLDQQLAKLRTLLNQVVNQQNENSSEATVQIRKMMTEIRQAVLPILRNHSNTTRQQP